jgi:hypothetical protein
MSTESVGKPWVLKASPNWTSGLRPTAKGVNPKDALGYAKVPLHLVPETGIILQAVCMDDGNIKYGPYNYRVEPIEMLGYLSAAKRHISAVMEGQDFDSVTGKPHLGYAMATLGIVIDGWVNGTILDNRPLQSVGGLMIDMLSSVPGAEPRSPEDYRKIFDTIQAAGKAMRNARDRT